MSAYKIILEIHSVLRWVALGVIIVCLVKSLISFFGKKEYEKIDNILSAAFVGFLDLQLLLGLVLYIFLSPYTMEAFQNMGAAMKDKELRFWAVEHITAMIVSIVIAHIARVKIKKTTISNDKFKIQLIYFGFAFALILFSIPWER